MNTITFFKDAFDNTVSTDCEMDVEWSELTEWFTENLLISEKKDSIGFVWAKYNTDAPVEYAPISGSNHAPKRDIFGKPLARRSASNVLTYFGLCLDYDGGQTLEEVKEHLIGVQHFGYTSFNHKIKGVDKFRVLVPFTTPCPHEEFHSRVQAFKEVFPGTDKQTFDSSRIFYAPNVAAANKQHYQCWLQDGSPFDWSELEATPPVQQTAPNPIVAQARKEGTLFSKDGTGLVDFTTFDIVQFCSDVGLQPKKAGPGKWNIICPKVSEHTGGNPGGTFINDNSGGNPHFYCSHSHGSGWIFDFFADQFGTRAWKNPYCERSVTKTTKGSK